MDALIIASVFQRCQVKKQISILSFAQRGKPTKKARLGPEKVVNTLEEEMVEVEETVQVGCVIMLCCCCCFWTGGEDYPYVGTYSMCRASGKSVNARLWQEVGRPTDAFAKQRAASL